MSTSSIFGDMLQTIAERGRRLLSFGRQVRPTDGIDDLERACHNLLSRRGEASGMALAGEILDPGAFRPDDSRPLAMVLDRLVRPRTSERAIDGTAGRCRTLRELPPPEQRQELSGGHGPTDRDARADAPAVWSRWPERRLDGVDDDFSHCSGLVNRVSGAERIEWSAGHFGEIIRYEAVHEIGDWDELRRRLDPEDRRCFAFFHPQLVDEPLIFVEVALTRSMSGSISELLSETRAPIRAEDATTAVFYSISNCQDGLRGISFGNFLIKQVVEELRRDLPRLETFVTLSPMSGFLSGLLRRGTRRRARSPTRTAPRWRRSRIPNGPPIPARGRRSKLRSCPQPRNTFCTPATSAACRSIRWPAFISAMARGSSASTSSPIGRRPPCASRTASWSTIFTSLMTSRPTTKLSSSVPRWLQPRP